MFEHVTMIRVRYGETDQMGYVYYGNYPLYYEQGRTEAIKALGLPYKRLEASGVFMPVADLHIRYKVAATYDDLLEVKTVIKDMPNRKMTFHTEIYHEDGRLLNVGETTLIFADATTRKACSAPQQLIDLLKPYFEPANH